MLPCFTSNDGAYLPKGDAVLGRQLRQCRSSGRILRTDLRNLAWREFGVRKFISSGLPFLRHFVVVIDALVAKEQVFRIHARRIVAAVENVRLNGHWAKVNLPRNTMGKKDVTESVATPVKATVPKILLLARPLPTSGFLADIAPKALLHRTFNH